MSPPKPKPAKAKPEPSYAHWQAEWEHRRADHGAGGWLVDKPELGLDAAPFLATLRALGYQTQDKRFHKLARRVLESGLINLTTGKWSSPKLVLANPFTQDLCEMLEEAIASGLSERAVLAEAAAVYEIKANSFRAAVERLRALLHAHRVSEKVG